MVTEQQRKAAIERVTENWKELEDMSLELKNDREVVMAAAAAAEGAGAGGASAAMPSQAAVAVAVAATAVAIYSDLSFDVDENTTRQVLYVPQGHILHVRYPADDIQGRTT